MDADQIARAEGEGNWDGGSNDGSIPNQIQLILLKNSLLPYRNKSGSGSISLQGNQPAQ
jgi:hypothetical protein